MLNAMEYFHLLNKSSLRSRSVHMEVAPRLETDAFINVLRRMVARRGNVTELWSDNSSNLVGANNELTKALSEMNQETVRVYTRQIGINWFFNPPTASSMGGSWGRIQLIKFLG